MKKSFICLIFSALCVASATHIQAQSLKGLFDKEEPVFYVSVTPTPDSSVAMMTLYFTHSKATSLEASLWIKDLGANLSPTGDNQMVKDLWEITNRKQDTIYLEGLTNLHFYTIGLDYRTPRAGTSRFATKVLRDNYRYEYLGKKSVASNKKTDPVEKMQSPCETPDLSVRSEAEGYCGADNRPAVLIECLNCKKGQTWSFNVEYSANGAPWKSLRSDGKSQTATGNAPRTEPLCILPDGEYKIRVSAMGENCTTPVYHYLGAPLHIGDKPAIAAKEETTAPPVAEPQVKKSAPVPDTCVVTAQATLSGKEIRGVVTLAAGSPCAGSQPYAQVRYVHPGHRDLNLGQLPLIAGKAASFKFDLDDIDLRRSIQTLQVSVYVSPEESAGAIPVSTQWIRATAGQAAVAEASNPARMQAKGVEEPMGNTLETQPKSYNRLQDLRPVYLSVESDVPAYIAWTNPAECINGGCNYTVWAGKSNGPIRLLAKGKQGGSLVKESLKGLTVEERYLEVEVETKAGASIAAYVFGQGSNYNFGENYVHRERIRPTSGQPEAAPKDLLVKQPEPTPVKEIATEEKAKESATSTTAAPEEKAVKKPNGNIPVYLEVPRLPIANFNYCKYQREISVVGDMPISDGDWLVIKYNFSEPGYKYTLYFQPEGEQEWFVTPGTKELQDKPEFYLEMKRYHSGRYAVLAYSFQNRWGCLSTPLTDALRIKVEP